MWEGFRGSPHQSKEKTTETRGASEGRKRDSHGWAVSSVWVRDSPPPPPPGPPGLLSYQGSMATGHTYGGAEGARKFFHSPCQHSIPPRPGGGAPQRYT